MAEHVDTTGPLTLSRKPRDTAHPFAQSAIGSTAFGATRGFPPRATRPAEIAQARMFEQLLHAECAELQRLAHRAGADSKSSGELALIRARLDEVDGLLRALQGRFPRFAPTGDR